MRPVESAIEDDAALVGEAEADLLDARVGLEGLLVQAVEHGELLLRADVFPAHFDRIAVRLSLPSTLKRAGALFGRTRRRSRRRSAPRGAAHPA